MDSHNAVHNAQVKPLVSIFITTFNRPEVLEKVSLPSALNQICNEPFEVIVVDDCSADNGATQRVVEDFQKKHANLRYVRHEVNKGLSAARNTGVDHAKGEFVVSLDDDDQFLPTFLQKTLDLIRTLPAEYGAVFVARTIDYGNGKTEYACGNPDVGFYVAIDDAWLIRRSVFDTIRYDEAMLTDEDADFGIQFFAHFKAKVIKEPLLIKGGHDISASQTGNFFSFSYPSERRYKGLKRFIERNESIFEERGSNIDKAFFYRFVGRNYCWGGRMQQGRPYLLKAVKTRPSPRNIVNYGVSLLGAAPYRWYWAFEVNTLRKIRSLLRK